MSISAFNPNAVAPTVNAPALNTAAPAANAPAINTSDSFSSSVAPVGTAPYQNAAPAQNAPMMNAPAANAPVANAPAANAAPAVMPPSYNQAPAAPAPVQAKSGGGGLFGTIAAGLAGGLGALKFVVPKFLPSLLKNPSTLKTFGIFGAGAAAAIMAFGFIKNKLMGGASAQQFPPEAIAQLQQLLAAGVPPEALLQQGVPVEALRQAGVAA